MGGGGSWPDIHIFVAGFVYWPKRIFRSRIFASTRILGQDFRPQKFFFYLQFFFHFFFFFFSEEIGSRSFFVPFIFGGSPNLKPLAPPMIFPFFISRDYKWRQYTEKTITRPKRPHTVFMSLKKKSDRFLRMWINRFNIREVDFQFSLCFSLIFFYYYDSWIKPCITWTINYN